MAGSGTQGRHAPRHRSQRPRLRSPTKAGTTAGQTRSTAPPRPARAPTRSLCLGSDESALGAAVADCGDGGGRVLGRHEQAPAAPPAPQLQHLGGGRRRAGPGAASARQPASERASEGDAGLAADWGLLQPASRVAEVQTSPHASWASHLLPVLQLRPLAAQLQHRHLRLLQAGIGPLKQAAAVLAVRAQHPQKVLCGQLVVLLVGRRRLRAGGWAGGREGGRGIGGYATCRRVCRPAHV